MVEYWKVEDPVFSGIDFKRKFLICELFSMSRGVLPVKHYTIFPKPIIPLFQYSNIPNMKRSGVEFVKSNKESIRQSSSFH